MLCDQDGIILQINGKIWKTTPNLETKKAYYLILWAKEEFKRDIRKYFELNEYENTKYQNSWDRAKVIFGENFIAPNYMEKKMKVSEQGL